MTTAIDTDKKFLLDTIGMDRKVYCILRHVSKSMMTRRISLIVIKDNKPYDITWAAAKVLGMKMHRDDHAIVIQGGGMDMGFHLVYTLSRCLFDDVTKTDPGYILEQDWI